MLTTATSAPPPAPPAREERGPTARGLRLRPASEKRNETHVRKKKNRVGDGKAGHTGHGTPRTRRPAAARQRAGTSQALGPGTPRAPRGGSRHAPPDRRLGKRRRPERGPAESEGAPDAGRNREALPQTTDPPYGPHRPPDHGDGRATPPGSLNLRAGTRELGTRTGAGRTREAQKAGRGARAHPRHRHPPTPARGRATPAPSVPESRGGGGAAGASRRASASRPPPGKRSRTTPGAHEITEPVGKEAERPRAADGSGGGGRTEA